MVPTKLWDMQTSLRSLYTLCTEPVCRRYSITRTELDILLFLADNPGLDTAAEISGLRCLAKSHVSTSLRSLERNGYIAKTAEAGDKRRIHLMLTEAADAVVRAGKQQQAAFADIILSDIGREELQHFHECIVQMENNIKKYLEAHASQAKKKGQ